MIALGCDIGSLTAKAVVLDDNRVIGTHMMRVAAGPVESASHVAHNALRAAGLGFDDVDHCYSTGYGRFEIPFSQGNKTEISCHGLGAHWLDHDIRCIIDIGGQDCKVIAVDENGMVDDFLMNDKCAAGTGRNLEILARTMGIGIDELGSTALHARGTATIAHQCNIFMELDVLHLLYGGTPMSEIAYAVNHAVALRVARMARSVGIRRKICLTGGVSKNIAVYKQLEAILGIDFQPLFFDPQLVGALGAAIFAWRAIQNQRASDHDYARH